MEATELPVPVRIEVRWWTMIGTVVRYARNDDRETAAGFDKPGDIAEVEIVCAEVVIGIQAYDRIEAFLGKRQGMRFSEDREHVSRYLRAVDSGPVLCG